MSIPQAPAALKQQIDECAGQLQTFVETAVRDCRPIHEVERGLWQQVVALGKQCLALFLALHGDGDMGATLPNPDGAGELRRLAERHPRRYVSIFGAFQLDRVVYGTRAGQKIDFAPLDNRLQLPEKVYSFVLQDWSQWLAAESSFAAIAKTLERLLGIQLSVDGLERVNEHMAKDVDLYREQRPTPPAAEEGEIFVAKQVVKSSVTRGR